MVSALLEARYCLETVLLQAGRHHSKYRNHTFNLIRMLRWIFEKRMERNAKSMVYSEIMELV